VIPPAQSRSHNPTIRIPAQVHIFALPVDLDNPAEAVQIVLHRASIVQQVGIVAGEILLIAQHRDTLHTAGGVAAQRQPNSLTSGAALGESVFFFYLAACDRADAIVFYMVPACALCDCSVTVQMQPCC